MEPGSLVSGQLFHRKRPSRYEGHPRETGLVDCLDTRQFGLSQVRILVVDDHAVVRHGTAALLATRPELVVVGEAASAMEAIATALATKPNIVLLDIGLGDEGGLFAAQEIYRVCPTACIIAFSGSDDPVHVRGVIAAGAKGYVLKTSQLSTIFSAIAVVLAGRRFLDPGLSDLVISQLELFPEVSRRSSHVLAPRETEVLNLLASGHTYREIAEMMQITISSVNAHRKRIYDKLGLTSRAEAVRYAIALGSNCAPNKRLPVPIHDHDRNSTMSKESSRRAV